MRIKSHLILFVGLCQSQSLLLTAPGIWPVSSPTLNTFGGRVIPVCSSFWNAFIIPHATGSGLGEAGGTILRVVISAVAVLVVSLIIIGLWKRLRLWGSWELHQQSPDGTRRRFIRKWYGWVEEQKALERERKWKAWKDWISQIFVLRTTTTDWRWVFWDQNGSAQRKYQERRDNTCLRYLPKWMRTDQRTVSQHAAQRASDESRAERGLLNFLSTPTSTTKAFDHNLSGILGKMLCATCKLSAPTVSEDSGSPTCRPSTVVDPHGRGSSTVRRRNSQHGSRAVWQSGSQEVNRAVQEQLPLPDFGPALSHRLSPEHPLQEPMFPFSPTDGLGEIEALPVPVNDLEERNPQVSHENHLALDRFPYPIHSASANELHRAFPRSPSRNRRNTHPGSDAEGFEMPSTVLGRVPSPPVRVHVPYYDRRHSFSSPADIRQIRARHDTFNPRLQLNPVTFQRLEPRDYIHNARPRGPSMLSQLALQMPSSSSSSAHSLSADWATSHAPPTTTLSQAEESSRLAGDSSRLVRDSSSRAESSSDDVSPLAEPLPDNADSLAVSRTSGNSHDSSGWSNAPYPRLRNVQWEGFSI